MPPGRKKPLSLEQRTDQQVRRKIGRLLDSYRREDLRLYEHARWMYDGIDQISTQLKGRPALLTMTHYTRLEQDSRSIKGFIDCERLTEKDYNIVRSVFR